MRTWWAILTVVALVACSHNSDAQQQAAYAKAVETDVVTKFILRDPNDPGNITGAYAVIRAQSSDSGAIWCTYETPGASQSSASSYVRLLKIQSDVEHNRLRYELLAPDDALGVIQAAPITGDSMSKISEILGTRPAGYDPFPTDANGNRRFLISSCRASQ